MKIKSLLLGSVAAAGLSTSAFAADLSVLTSLDVCDALGISGLTISSDTNCLQITGEVSYEFNWGDYAGSATGWPVGTFAIDTSNYDVDANDDGVAAGTDDNQDWSSRVKSWLKFVATADSDFGPAKAVIKLKSDDEHTWTNEVDVTPADASGTNVFIDEAYVSVGDSTVLMAGDKGSIGNTGDDEPYNFLGLYNSEVVDAGVGWQVTVADGGHVIQVVSDLGNGVSVGLGLEDLQNDGTLVGVMSYAGDTVAAHATFYATDVLLGAVNNWAIHAGATVSVDMMNFRVAVAADDTGWWNGLASAEATFDMFTLAASVEGTSADEIGFGASASADVTDGVTINAGFRWFDYDTTTVETESWQAALQLVADVTETITLTGELGIHGENFGATDSTVTYGAAQLAWAPGGGFTSSVKGQANSAGAYKVTFKAAKSFE